MSTGFTLSTKGVVVVVPVVDGISVVVETTGALGEVASPLADVVVLGTTLSLVSGGVNSAPRLPDGTVLVE